MSFYTHHDQIHIRSAINIAIARANLLPVIYVVMQIVIRGFILDTGVAMKFLLYHRSVTLYNMLNPSLILLSKESHCEIILVTLAVRQLVIS